MKNIKVDQEHISQHSTKYMGKLDHLLQTVSEKVSGKALGKNTPANQKFKMTQPKSLVGGKLKQYQFQALEWMIQLAKREMNGILADDMGLGKTIQTIAYFAYLKQEFGVTGKHLIVAPLTVLKNWERQLNKWFPSCNSVILWATQKQRQKILHQVVRPKKFDILITSYQGLIIASDVLKRIKWECVIIDQAHKMKNDQAMLTQTGKKMKGNFKLMLTGTPLSNNLRQLWSLLNFIMPQIFYQRQIFDQIENCVNIFEGTQQQKFKYQCDIAKKFHGIIKHFIKRRTKAEIDLGLPPKYEKTLFVSMTKLQLKMYKNMLKYKNVYGPSKDRDHNIQIQLRKICNHPYVFPQIQGQGLPQYGDHLIKTCGKMILLDKLLRKLIPQKNKILIFSQFTRQLDILEDYCQYRDYDFCRIDGQTKINQRQEMMDIFNQDQENNIPIFLISTRAGGLGVNLVSANVVIIYDIDWNPQNDNQAMDRAYRIGQKRPVNVYKFITQHTVQERMLEVQKYKLIWDELVIQKGAIVNLKKNQDVLEGLDYQKIAEMKKGQIFKLKIQDDQDTKTIQQIITMGQQKDQQKYKQIKEKIMKQLAQNKQAINPFNQQEAPDADEQHLMKTYFGQNLKKTISVPQKQIGKMTRIRFINSISLPHWKLYQNSENIIAVMYKIAVAKQRHRHDLQNPQVTKLLQELQKELQVYEKDGFQNWDQSQFDRFVQANKIYLRDDFDSIQQFIQTKSKQQIIKYSKAFYENKHQGFLNLQRIQIQVIKVNQRLYSQKVSKQLSRALKDYGAVYYQKRNTKIQNKFLSQLPIEDYMAKLKIQDNSSQPHHFQEQIKNKPVVQALKQYLGQKSCQQHYFKEVSQVQLIRHFNLAKNKKDLTLQNLHSDKTKYYARYNYQKEEMLAKLEKKYIGNGSDKINNITSEQISKGEKE